MYIVVGGLLERKGCATSAFCFVGALTMACPGQPDVLRLEAMKSEFEPEKSPPMTCPENEGSSVVVLAKDEGVKKYILTKGKGDKEGKRPQRDAKCFVHYTV